MMLDIQNVKKHFEDHVVLDGISLGVEKGDVVAILGPSGSGKTTFLRCLNFLERADEGEMIFEGRRYDMNKAGKKEVTELRRKTAFVFQNYNLFLNKTVLQNVTLGLTLGSKIPKQDAREIAVESLRRVGMADRLDSYPVQLSGGQQQRVAIARALMLSPDILCFDEPTSALDPELTGEVLNVIKGLKSADSTMIIVTHEIGFAHDVADKIIFMDNGFIEEEGTPQQVIDNPTSDRTREFLARFNQFGD